MKLSIGIISYQADDALLQSLDSLGSIPNDCEVLLQVSTASNLERMGSPDNVRLLPPGDNGIYHAMNKIRLAACGEYLWYLNAGDAMHPDLTLTAVLTLLTKASCCGFQSEQIFGDGVYLRPSASESRPPFYRIGHQSSLYHRDAYQHISFDEQIPVSSDVKFNIACFSLIGMHYIPRILSQFHLGGISNRYRTADFKHYRGESLTLRVKFIVKACPRLIIGQRLLYRLLALGKYDHYQITADR